MDKPSLFAVAPARFQALVIELVDVDVLDAPGAADGREAIVQPVKSFGTHRRARQWVDAFNRREFRRPVGAWAVVVRAQELEGGGQ